MVFAKCVICGDEFRKRNIAKTCSPSCSKQHSKNLTANWKKQNPGKTWAKRHPERKYKANRKWESKNKEKSKLARLAWRVKNPERLKDNKRTWISNNRDKAALYTKKYRQRQKERLSRDKIIAILNFDVSKLLKKDKPK